jgi:hypothetical protein
VQRGKNGAEVRWQPMREKRMPLHDAREIWFSRKIRTNAKALRKMRGWTQSAAYTEFGASGRPPGNPGGRKS